MGSISSVPNGITYLTPPVASSPAAKPGDAAPVGVAGPVYPSAVSAADVTNATPNQQAPIAEQTQALQRVQNMFYPPLMAGNLNVLA